MNKKFLVLLILVIFIFSVSAASAKMIKVGGVACLTGAAATYGASTRNGTVLAFKEANDEGGVDIGGTKYLIHYSPQLSSRPILHWAVKQGFQYLFLIFQVQLTKFHFLKSLY